MRIGITAIIMLLAIWISSCTSYDKVSDKEYRKLQTLYDSLLPAWITRFENDIIAFEIQDSLLNKPEYDIVFIGSSTFEQWKTMQQDFAPSLAINRGFGGSTIREVIYYSDRILFPYKPKVVVLYVGNDVWGDPVEPSTEQLFDYFRLFEKKLHRELPNTVLDIISMRPSPVKKELLEKQTSINNLLLQFAHDTPRTRFIDIRPLMYGSSGQLRTDIFKPDSLHLNDTGNKLITAIIKPIVIKQLDSEL
jgi:hypothetical protein